MERVEYPRPDKDEASNEALFHEPESNECALSSSPPPPKVVLFCPLPHQVCHLKWWLTKSLVYHLDIFYMYAEIDNNESIEMQLKFQIFAKSLCIRNYTQSRQARPKSHSSKPCGNNSEVLGVD